MFFSILEVNQKSSDLLRFEVRSPSTVLHISVLALGPRGEGVALGQRAVLRRHARVFGSAHVRLDLVL
jgi:hypothetical protein